MGTLVFFYSSESSSTCSYTDCCSSGITRFKLPINVELEEYGKDPDSHENRYFISGMCPIEMVLETGYYLSS